MTGLWATHHKNIENDIKSTKKAATRLFFGFLVCAIAIGALFYKLSLSDNANVAILATLLSLFTLTASMGSQYVINYAQTDIYLDSSLIRRKHDELNNIKESIELFYLPLNDLLTTYNENVVSKAKTRKIAEINSHRYLAEPCVRRVFETYIQNNDGGNRGSNELLRLLRSDMELLQNKLIELKTELNCK